jgi:L-iditol 2-dehydrogenase
VRLAVLSAPRRLEVVDEPVPEPGPGEVLPRVASCGVCASELDMWEGAAGIDYPRFPGHEVSGTVGRLGPGVNRFSRGDPVAAWVTGRGFADYVAVRAEYCFAAGSVPLDPALAEPLACAVNAVELAAPTRARTPSSAPARWARRARSTCGSSASPGSTPTSHSRSPARRAG